MNNTSSSSRRTTWRRSRRGVALMDAIIGGVMLGIGLAGLLSVSSSALGVQRQGELRMQAAWLADEYMNMVLIEGPTEYSKVEETSGRCSAPFERFDFTVDIESQGLGLPFLVTVIVAWDDEDASRVVLSSYIAERIQPVDVTPPPREPLERLDRLGIWDEKINGEDA